MIGLVDYSDLQEGCDDIEDCIFRFWL